ncbi:flagellar basal body L-ring protein FlgH [Sulfurimonas sp. SAG-AH-194-I05]|nr:flagellar basal body L-ring protein FlgH [Sulfurimonas sp. SAG-AH-194-I05]MDF1875688.1 flagellar basal body L-ring protein FlgH [Sulfurimonas sp. SAG-AH-194-I05]
MQKKILTIFTVLGVSFFLHGCTAGLADPKMDFKPPVYVEQIPSKEDEKNFTSVGSIFGQGDNPLFSDHKAMHVHDIVTVIISETAKSSSSSAKKLSEADKSALGGGIFTGGGISGQVASNVNGISRVGFNTESTSDFSGTGSSTKDASFTATISARIIKVLSNGNYFISGRREILVDRQKQIVQLTGVIRPYDISQDNQIDSSKISDAKILYKTQGDVDRAAEQAWGTKIVQSIWPF